MRPAAFAAALAAVLFLCPEARAQPAAPDLVRMRDGGMLRGTIAELVPGQHVVIVLATGETRRIAAAQFEYAGAVSREPSAADAGSEPPIVTNQPAARGVGFTEVSRGAARLRLQSDEPGMTFHRVTGSATATAWGPGGVAVASGRSYERLCAAPCEIDGAVGVQELALSIGTEDPIPARDPIAIGGDVTLIGHYTSRSGLRTAGYVTLFAGMGAGIAMIFAGLLPGLDVANGGEINPALMFGGTGLTIASAIAGAILATRKDLAEIEVR